MMVEVKKFIKKANKKTTNVIVAVRWTAGAVGFLMECHLAHRRVSNHGTEKYKLMGLR
jgi:hypothetical protein